VAKGRKTGGRQKGARNVASVGIKTLLGEVLSDGELKSRWKNWLGHRDERIAFEAFKLALSYLYGQPVQPVVGEELRHRSRSTLARSLLTVSWLSEQPTAPPKNFLRNSMLG
jgi:hypothetical protein